MLQATVCACLAIICFPESARADDAVWAALQRGGYVILLRHAVTTPGVGDPPGFKLDDCRTQRNLTDEGRADARKLGDALRTHNVHIDRVLSSPWCRCIETAQLAFGSKPETSAALANLFGEQNRELQIAEMRKLVSGFNGRGNLVLVSHGSTIASLTGVSPQPAEMVVVKPDGSGNFSLAGRLSAR